MIFFSLRLFSPTNHTNFTPLFSLKRLFSPRNARNSRNFIIYFPQITQIKMIFTIRIQRFALLLRKNRSTELHRFLPYGIFLDMKTREHNFFSLWLFSPTECTELTFYCVNGNRRNYEGCCIVYLSYIYSIFMVYL